MVMSGYKMLFNYSIASMLVDAAGWKFVPQFTGSPPASAAVGPAPAASIAAPDPANTANRLKIAIIPTSPLSFRTGPRPRHPFVVLE